jgi:hypothetical protein
MTTAVLLRSGMMGNYHVPFWRAVEEATPSLTLIIGRKSKQNGFTGLSRGCESPAITNQYPRLIAVLKNPLAFRQGSVKDSNHKASLSNFFSVF